MRSEIPQLEVITAIGDAELEDYVAQLLFTQGWSIIYRAFDQDALNQYLNSRSSELRTVIVYTGDLPGFSEIQTQSKSSVTTSIICLDGIKPSAHEIMQKIRSQLRLPMVHASQPVIVPTDLSSKAQQVLPKLILVTGTSGGPGKTQFALTLAAEVSKTRKTTLIDADFRNFPLEQSMEVTDFSILSLRQEEKPQSIQDPHPQEVTIVDIGILAPLLEVVHDRRWLAILHNNLIERATQIIYVSNSTKSSLLQLDQFKRELPLLMQKAPITYINVGRGSVKELRQAQLAFGRIVGSNRQYLIPDSSLFPSPKGIFDSLFSPAHRGKKEIGTIATSLI